MVRTSRGLNNTEGGIRRTCKACGAIRVTKGIKSWKCPECRVLNRIPIDEQEDLRSRFPSQHGKRHNPSVKSEVIAYLAREGPVSHVLLGEVFYVPTDEGIYRALSPHNQQGRKTKWARLLMKRLEKEGYVEQLRPGDLWKVTDRVLIRPGRIQLMPPRATKLQESAEVLFSHIVQTGGATAEDLIATLYRPPAGTRPAPYTARGWLMKRIRILERAGRIYESHPGRIWRVVPQVQITADMVIQR